MENHPIPQDVTGFQFKLIGDMTIKQFAYLATGVVLGWVIFSLPLTSFIKIPLSSFFILLGISFAFFSLAGRPMDTMITNFVKTLFKPTQFVYQPLPVTFAKPSNQPSQQKAAQNITMQSTPKIEEKKLDERESGFFSSLEQMFHSQSNQNINIPQNTSGQAMHPRIISAVSQSEEKKKISFVRGSEEEKADDEEKKKMQELAQKEAQLALALNAAKAEEKKDEGSQLYQDAHQKVIEIEKLLNETALQKQQLETELLNLKRQLEESKKQVFAPSLVEEKLPQTQNVKAIPKGLEKKVGIPLTSEYPNIISGIIKDPRGNPLSNILVEVKDKEGNPVRAFKTNPLGQFAASTPLTNGTFRIEFEDPQKLNKFQIVEFKASGNIILPLEVTSIDAREELRKTLFS